MKIAQGSKSLIIISFFVCLVFFVLIFITNQSLLRLIFLFFAVLIFLKSFLFLIFFRDPDRKIGKGIVASADGKIREISNINDDDVGNCKRISTFMNLHNVHVNRIPIEGIVSNITHKKGLHLPAFKKESEKNERVVTIINTNIGTVKVIQIAGTIARRIHPYIKIGDKMKKGEKIGIIKFGSRVDVYLPTKKLSKISVRVGDIVKAGETTIAEIND